MCCWGESCRTDNYESRADEFPADPPVESRFGADHGFDVLGESVQTVEPGDSDGFEESRTQKRDSSRISIKQIEGVDSTLKYFPVRVS
jgi:hypothetical protein